MSQLGTKQLLEALSWRYATKAFDPEKKIDAATWEALEKALVLTPSSFGLQPWRFFVVDDPALRESLIPISWGQRQVADASHLVVFAMKDPVTIEDVATHMEETARLRGTSRESLAAFEKVVCGFLQSPPYPLDLRAWVARQVYLALGSFMTSAALLGIDTCPMEGIDPAAYDRILGIEGSGYFSLVACAAGFRCPSDKHASLPKVRFPKDKIIQHLP